MCCCCCGDSDDEKKPKKAPAPVKNTAKGPPPKTTVVTQPRPTPSPAPIKAVTPPPVTPPPVVVANVEKTILEMMQDPSVTSYPNILSMKNIEVINDQLTKSLGLYNHKTVNGQLLTLQLKYEEQKVQLSANDPRFLDTQANLAQQLMRRTGRYKDALKLCEAVFEVYEKSLGPDHEKTLSIQLLYSHALLRLTLHEEALYSFKKLYELTNYHKSNSKTIQNINIQALIGISSCFKLAGDFKRAMDTLDQLRDKRVELYGEFSVETIGTQFNMVKVLKKQGRLKEANALALTAYKDLIVEGKWEPLDLQLILNEHILGTLCRDESHPNVAFQILLQIYDKEVQIFGPSHPYTISTLLNFGILFERVGKDDLAVKIYADVYDKRKAILEESHPKSLKAKIRLSNLKGPSTLK